MSLLSAKRHGTVVEALLKEKSHGNESLRGGTGILGVPRKSAEKWTSVPPESPLCHKLGAVYVDLSELLLG